MGLNFVWKYQRSTALKYRSLRIRNLKLEAEVPLNYLTDQRPNLKNLSRGLNPPKPGLNYAPA